MIEAESISIRDRDQEKVEQDLHYGEIRQKPSGDKTVIDPAEGALDLSDSPGAEKFFDRHGCHPLFRMIPFSFGQIPLSIWACISRQGKVLKRKVISRGLREISSCISRWGRFHNCSVISEARSCIWACTSSWRFFRRCPSV